MDRTGEAEHIYIQRTIGRLTHKINKIMTLEQIKKAISEGTKVYWQNTGYEIQQGKEGLMVQSTIIDCSFPLTDEHGEFLYFKELDFFTLINK